MKLLTATVIGSGVDDGSVVDPYRPDLPPGVAYAGALDRDSGTYLVAVPDAAVVSAKAGRTALSTTRQKSDALTARNLSEATVNIWRVG